MSYILEALKKAQAERQLGDTPTIHAPALDIPATHGTSLRKPLVAVVAVMGIVIAGLAAVVWRQATVPAVPEQPAPAAKSPQVVATLPAAPTQAPVMPVPAPAVSVPSPVAQVAKPPPAVAAKAPEPARRAEAPAAVSPSKAPDVAPDVAPVIAAKPAKADEPPREEPVQALRDLPEPIRRAVPALAMSGYMYSPNPSDRLILIDKVLRREGDEVAPGLVLERLEPKGAVFAFRGYRYRMPY